jgi:hypothetical protein
MNKLEERHYKSVWVAYHFNGEQPNKDFAKDHATTTKEIAIGFSKWVDTSGWDWHGEFYTRFTGVVERKTDSELFEMYLNTLK